LMCQHGYQEKDGALMQRILHLFDQTTFHKEVQSII
jgi:hypothetical protein